MNNIWTPLIHAIRLVEFHGDPKTAAEHFVNGFKAHGKQTRMDRRHVQAVLDELKHMVKK